jgi:hydrophobic/amphiphilic exporter-1 (mainly G- bacteria), HAE1 family
MTGDRGGLPALSVRRPYLAAVMNLLIVIAGLAALFGIEIRELPDVDRPVVSVRANYPGASPTTIDAEVTSVLEGAVARVAGVLHVRSSSEEGNMRISVEFRPNYDLALAANDVREAVSRVERRLPSGVEDLFIVKSDQDAQPVVYVAISSLTDAVDELTRKVEDEIVPQFTAIDGISDVMVFGARERVVRVAVKPPRLTAYGLSIAEVADVLRDAQFDVPVGSFEGGELQVLVRADATVTDPDRIKDLRIRNNVRIGDVADVYFGTATPTSISRLNGGMVVTLGIVRQAQSNTVRISDNVQEVIGGIERRYPELNLHITQDDAVFIRGAIEEVLLTLLFALVIVVGVLWLFFGQLAVTAVPAVAIPIALIGSLAGIWALGFSINLITLLALVLATGVVVDDAIVVTENIQRCRARGMGPMAAAVVGTRQVFFAVIATTVTLIAVFIPISFLPSEAGRLFTEFGFVLALTVALSSFVALSVCPMIASRLGGLGQDAGGSASVGRWIARGYAAVLGPMVRAPLVTVVAAGVIAGGAILIYGTLGEELIPPEDRGSVVVRLQGPDGAGLNYTDRQVEAVERMFTPWIERGVAEILYSITGRWDLNRGEIGLRLVPWEDRTVSQEEIEADLRPHLSRLAGAPAYLQPGNSLNLRGGADGGIRFALTGPSYPEIAEAAFAFADQLNEIPGLSRARVQYQATQPQISIVIDRTRAANLGIAMSDLSSTLRALVDEDEVAEITIDDKAVPVFLQSAAGVIRDPSDLLNLSVRAESGALIPLSQIVSFREQGVAAELDRYGQRRAVEMDADIATDLSMAEAIESIRDVATESLPDGIRLLFLGEAAALDETSSALMATYLIALAIIFLVLVAQFESLTSAVVVMITVPFGVCAAIYALWLTGTTINIFSQIGVLMLIGIMAKNGILLVEFADQLRDRGMSVWEAAAEAADARLRPIAMTLASTVLAGLPLILSGGPGAEARAAIGWVIFGGLGLATVFTLFLTPAAYALVAGLSRPRAEAGARLEKEMAATRTFAPGE